MKMKFIVGGVVVLGVSMFGWWLYSQQTAVVPAVAPVLHDEAAQAPSSSTIPLSVTKTVSLQEIAEVDSHLRLAMTIPTTWVVTAVPVINAITISDPAAAGSTSLEQSQIFLRYFEADKFLTLTTVDVLERTELSIQEREAVRYRIKKKLSVVDFPNQPSWRNSEHEVTDIRESTDNPSVFYVIARNPSLPVEQFNQILDSLVFDVDQETAAAIGEPIEGFVERVTLKPFGILIDQVTSPVQPERFGGYHTGADAEFTSQADRDREISVHAVLDGSVVTSKTASGYGGVMVLEHELDGKAIFGIYGHLKPSSMKSVGATVARGDQIAVLGAGGTSETDGERKHLHFGLYTSSPVSIAGYVSSQSALVSWLDPLSLLQRN